MTSTRAILVSEEQRNFLAADYGPLMDTDGPEYGAHLVHAYDNAADQPRKRVCATHDYRDATLADGTCCGGCRKRWPREPCRVVTAIVVVEEDA